MAQRNNNCWEKVRGVRKVSGATKVAEVEVSPQLHLQQSLTTRKGNLWSMIFWEVDQVWDFRTAQV